MRNDLDTLQKVFLSWPGVSVNPHRFGGLEFNLGAQEIGHIHYNGMVDIPFNSQLCRQLVAEGQAGPHHIYPETGWITFYIHSDADVQQAIWLFRLSYLFNASRGQNRIALQDQINLAAQVDALHLSPELRTVFERLTRSAHTVEGKPPSS